MRAAFFARAEIDFHVTAFCAEVFEKQHGFDLPEANASPEFGSYFTICYFIAPY